MYVIYLFNIVLEQIDKWQPSVNYTEENNFKMADVNHLVLAILKFMDDQQRSPDLTPDAIESLEGRLTSTFIVPNLKIYMLKNIFDWAVLTLKYVFRFHLSAVATQCLESAYGVSIRDVDAVAHYPLPAPLLDIFAAGLAQLVSQVCLHLF